MQHTRASPALPQRVELNAQTLGVEQVIIIPNTNQIALGVVDGMISPYPQIRLRLGIME